MFGYAGALAACAVALVVAVPVAAQESINHASVSGRVTDAQGAVVPGATVTARQVETDVSASGVTDEGGRFRFPYLRVGTYDLSVQLAGFAEARRRIALSVGAAFEIPFVLAVEGVAASVDRRRRGAGARIGPQSDRDHRVGGGGAGPAAQRPQLPRHRAAGAGRRAAEHQQHAALRRDLRRAGRRVCRWAASATCRTASSWTGCRPTTMPRA